MEEDEEGSLAEDEEGMLDEVNLSRKAERCGCEAANYVPVRLYVVGGGA